MMSHGSLALASLLLLLQGACGDRPRDPSDGAGGRGGTSPDSGGGAAGAICSPVPSAMTMDCINGCVTGHVLSARICQDGAWVCPFGTNPTADCGGAGDCPPSSGGPCTDGASGILYEKQCSNGTWMCPPGTHSL